MLILKEWFIFHLLQLQLYILSTQHFPFSVFSPHVVHIPADRSSETSRGVPTFLCPFHVRSSPPRDHLRKPTINSSGGSCDACWITDTKRENFLGVQIRSDRVQPVISDPHAARRCSGEAAGHPACSRENPIKPVLFTESSFWKFLSLVFFLLYLYLLLSVQAHNGDGYQTKRVPVCAVVSRRD